MEVPEVIDISAIESGFKHLVVFEKFDALKPGQAMILNSDHDSRSLYYHLVAERGQAFQWELLENGSGKWQIKITKSAINSDKETIGKIISLDYRKSRALNSLGIDFSCGGHRTLRQAFEGKEIFLNDVSLRWEAIDQLAPEKGMNYLDWDMAFLIGYIIQLHHKFVCTQTKFIIELAFKVAESNSSRNPEIKDVADLFALTGKMLELKGQKEEKVLFPYITALSAASISGTTLKAAEFGHISVPISLIQVESEKVVADLRRIRQLTNNYIAPVYSSSTCPILYKLLAAYEEDAHLHLHLENNILFPKAIKTENRMHSKNQITKPLPILN